MVAHLRNEDLESYSLKFQQEVTEIRFNLVESFSQGLNPYKISKEYLQYELPPKSPFFIGGGMNFRNMVFDEIELKPEGRDTIFLNAENRELMETGKNFGGRYYGWYTIN